RPLPVLLLQIARGDVTNDGRPEDAARRLRRAHPARASADDHAELRLVIDPLRDARGRELDGPVRIEERRGRLEEEQWLLRRLVAELVRVGFVVAANAEDLRRHHRREPSMMLAGDHLAGGLAPEPWRVAEHARVAARELGEHTPAVHVEAS